MTVIPVVIGALGTTHKGLVKGLEDLKIRVTSRDHLDSIKIGQNTDKSPRHLKRFAVTQTPVN